MNDTQSSICAAIPLTSNNDIMATRINIDTKEKVSSDLTCHDKDDTLFNEFDSTSDTKHSLKALAFVRGAINNNDDLEDNESKADSTLAAQLNVLAYDDAVKLAMSVVRAAVALRRDQITAEYKGDNDDVVSNELNEQLNTALQYLSRMPAAENVKNDDRLHTFMRMRGLYELVEVTRVYAKETPLIALKTLYRLSSVEMHIQTVIDADVPQATLAVLARHVKNIKTSSSVLEGVLPVQLLSDGLLLLGNLAFDTDAREKIGACGGIEIILSLMKASADIVVLLDQCCYALANLAVDSQDNMMTMVRGGIVQCAIAAMRRHHTQLTLLESASFVLTNLCAGGSETRILIVESGAGDVLAHILISRHSTATTTSRPLFNTILRTLGNLSFSSYAIAMLLRAYQSNKDDNDASGDVLAAIAGVLADVNSAVEHVELAVIVLANMAAEALTDELRVLTRLQINKQCVLPELFNAVRRHVQECPRLDTLLLGLIDKLCTRVPELIRTTFAQQTLMPYVVHEAPRWLDATLVRISSIHHALHVIGVLAGYTPNADLIWASEDVLQALVHAVQNAMPNQHNFGHGDVTATATNSALKTLVNITNYASGDSTTVDIGSALQALWCIGRLSVQGTLEQVRRFDAVELAQRLLDTLLLVRPTPNWSAVSICVRVLSVLCQTFRQLSNMVARFAMPLIGRALARLADAKRPDPDASASFAYLLAALSQSATARLHLNMLIAKAILRLLATATRADATMTVSAAASFIRVLCTMTASDRRGQVRAALIDFHIVNVADALMRGARTQFGDAPTPNNKTRSVATTAATSPKSFVKSALNQDSLTFQKTVTNKIFPTSTPWKQHSSMRSVTANDVSIDNKCNDIADVNSKAAEELASAVAYLHEILDENDINKGSGKTSISSSGNVSPQSRTSIDSKGNRRSFHEIPTSKSSPTRAALRALDAMRRASFAPYKETIRRSSQTNCTNSSEMTVNQEDQSPKSYSKVSPKYLSDDVAVTTSTYSLTNAGLKTSITKDDDNENNDDDDDDDDGDDEDKLIQRRPRSSSSSSSLSCNQRALKRRSSVPMMSEMSSFSYSAPSSTSSSISSYYRIPTASFAGYARNATSIRDARAQGIADTVTAVKGHPNRRRMRSTDGLCTAAQIVSLTPLEQIDARMALAVDDGSITLHALPPMSSWIQQKRSCIAASASRRMLSANTIESSLQHTHESNWDYLLNQCGTSGDILREQQCIHELIARGIPVHHRERVWTLLSGAELLRLRYNTDYYEHLVQIAADVGSPNADEIRKDVPRTMPHLSLFQSIEGRVMLERVLTAYCLRNSESVGYCQSMNIVCGALLTTMSESKAFWTFSTMIESRMGYYCRSMCALLVDQRVLRDLVAFELPIIFDHFANANIEIEAFTTSWFLCLFLEAPLKMMDALIVWDHLMLYGDEVIFEVALAIFRASREQILSRGSESEILMYVLHGIGDDLPPATILLADARKRISTNPPLAQRICLLRSLHQHALVSENDRLRPGTLLSLESKSMYGETNIARLWRDFLSPAPWHILLHASLPTAAALQQALSVSVFAGVDSEWRDSGLLSGLMQRLFEVVDANGTRQVDFGDFLAVAHVLEQGSEDEKLALCFRFTDKDADRLVSRSELYTLITMLEHSYNGTRALDNTLQYINAIDNEIDGATEFCDAIFGPIQEDKHIHRYNKQGQTSVFIAEHDEPTLDIEEFSHFALLHPLICSFFKLSPAPLLLAANS